MQLLKDINDFNRIKTLIVSGMSFSNPNSSLIEKKEYILDRILQFLKYCNSFLLGK